MNRKFLKFEIDLDFVLVAITTPLRDYRVCYLINKLLKLDFVKTDDLEIDLHPNSGPVFFSRYNYFEEPSETDFYLIANKGTDGYLIPEMRKVDYFILIKNYIDDTDLDRLVSGVNHISEIVAAVKIDPKKVKSRENLLF